MVVLWHVDSRGLPPPSCTTCHFPGLGLCVPVPEGREDSSHRSQQRYPTRLCQREGLHRGGQESALNARGGSHPQGPATPRAG